MIAVDTNVLARLILQDDTEQHAKSYQLFADRASEVGAIWISDVVLAELVWVLTRAAGHSRAEVSTVLTALTRNATVQLASPAAVREAARLYETASADFADCLLSVQAASAGARSVMTFDRKMRKLPGVQLL
jgi:predicted nucleic-acid-binding protein